MARPILHLGATSAFVMDNSDLLQARSAIELVTRKLVNVIDDPLVCVCKGTARILEDMDKYYKVLMDSQR